MFHDVSHISASLNLSSRPNLTSSISDHMWTPTSLITYLCLISAARSSKVMEDGKKRDQTPICAGGHNYVVLLFYFYIMSPKIAISQRLSWWSIVPLQAENQCVHEESKLFRSTWAGTGRVILISHCFLTLAVVWNIISKQLFFREYLNQQFVCV